MDVVILEKLTYEDHLLRKVELANVNDITPMPEMPEEIERRLGTLPKYMGLYAGYRGVWIAHLLESRGIQGAIEYRRHTYKGETYGKYRFRYNEEFDTYIYPEKKRMLRRKYDRKDGDATCMAGCTGFSCCLYEDG